MPIVKPEAAKVQVNRRAQKRDYIFAVGRRREAVARVRLYTEVKEGAMWNDQPIVKGEIMVNNKPISTYFPSEFMRYKYSEPLRVANVTNKYAFTISVAGGGQVGQLEAVVHGISGALSKLDVDAHRSVLKKKGFLTRDPRTRERRKVGTGGKARRAKQSPKR